MALLAISVPCKFSTLSFVTRKGLGKGGYGAARAGTLWLKPMESRMEDVMLAVERRIRGMPVGRKKFSKYV
jgi:hypothetical protein